MWQVHGLEGRLLVGWERGKTEKGVPYYIHHKSEQTQWDHPLLVSTMEEILDCNNAKYAAYRTASKIRILQKFAKLHSVTLPTIISLFDQHGFRLDQNDALMLTDQLESLLTDIFHVTKREEPSQMDTKLLAEISLNILMNFYDRFRSGMIKVYQAKVALTLLCSARLQEKYKYLFRQFADHNNCISKNKMVELLNSLAQIPEYVSEKPSFGLPLVPAAVESCFRLQSGQLGLHEESFLEWLLCEPQTLVWISTLYRLASAEAVQHDAKCSVCKMCPIIGLRYQCLRCFHYDLCQNCFFMGLANKRHKLYHPLQEYCFKSTSKEGTKALMKTIRNKLSKKTSAKSKQRYLPIVSGVSSTNDINGITNNNHDLVENQENALPMKVSKVLHTEHIPDKEEPEEEREAALHSRTIIQQSLPQNGIGNDHHYRELESTILHLEDQNRQLLNEIDKMCLVGPNNAMTSQSDQQQRAQVNLRREVLADHKYQLELQLKSLLQCLEKMGHNAVTNDNVGLQAQPKTSTPALPMERPQLTFLSPINPVYTVNRELSGSIGPHVSQSSSYHTNGWGRTFGNQSGFARQSLPTSSFQRNYHSQESSASFQRASARAVLQSREFSNTGNHPVPRDAPFLVPPSYRNPQSDQFHLPTANPTQHVYSDISSEESSRGAIHFRNCTNHSIIASLARDPDTSDGYNRIHLELGSIISKLEDVYPGCLSHQAKNETELGDKAKIMQAAGEIENMLKELVIDLAAAKPSRISE